MRVLTVEEFFGEIVGKKFGEYKPGNLPISMSISVSVPDMVAETYYDFLSIALQLSELGYEPRDEFPGWEYKPDDGFEFAARFVDHGYKRIYVQRGFKGEEPYCNIGVRNYHWPDNLKTIKTSEDMQRAIRQIPYGPDFIGNAMRCFNSPDGRFVYLK